MKVEDVLTSLNLPDTDKYQFIKLHTSSSKDTLYQIFQGQDY
jgi:hypothetical protein